MGRKEREMRKVIIAMLICVSVLMAFTGCNPKAPAPGDEEIAKAVDEAVEGYLGAFGHVRVLGDIDHVLKGEKVDDEPGVTTQSMVAGDVKFNATKTELTIPLTLTKYDFDGHRNPEDPTPEKYTRIATGKATLTLKGALNAEGTGFVANGYTVTGLDITLDCDDTTYILLDLPTVKLTAEKLEGIFTTAGGISRATLTVNVADGKTVGIADLDTPKFGKADGDYTATIVDDEAAEDAPAEDADTETETPAGE